MGESRPHTVVAVDVGGTGIKAALVDGDLTRLVDLHRPTPVADGGAAVVDAIAEVVRDLADEGARRDTPPAAAGVAVPGVVDTPNGVVRRAVNVGWANVPLRDLVAERTGLPVVVDHDVRTGGLAEFTVGAGRTWRDFAFVPVGTGIAAAFVLDGVPVAGAGYVGELGHVVIDEGGEPCACGARGCLETIAAASAIARRYSRRTGTTVAGAAEVAARLHDDEHAAEVWREAVTALGYGLSIVVSLLAPEIVVIGGGLAQAGAALFDPLRADLEARLTFQQVPRLAAAALGDRAGVTGAAILAHRLADEGGTGAHTHR